MRGVYLLIATLGLGVAVPPASPWQFSARVAGIPVTDSAGHAMSAPFLGGFDVPRPQLVDINGDGHPVLFVQERANEIMMFEREGDAWVWRTDHYQDLNVGEWFRFLDVDGDGKIDLLGEMPSGYIRMWRNVGTKAAAKFAALGDSIRDVDGHAILADRQNILNSIDIDCNGKLDLFIGRVQGTVDRFEQEGSSPDGSPRFRLVDENWQGIEVLGPEVTGVPVRRDTIFEGGPMLGPGGSSRHGANTLTFADIEGKGVLDLFWGDFFEPGVLRFENTGTCAQPNLTGRPIEFPRGHAVLTSGYNAPTFGDVYGDGNLDLIIGVIGGAYGPRMTAVDNLYLVRQAPKGTWTVATTRLIPTIDVGSEALPVLADLHGDGKLDLLIGNKISPNDENTASITWFENVGTKTAPAFKERGVIPAIKGEFNYAPTVVDLDGDGLPDIVVGTWRDRIEWYRNTGTHAAPAWTLADTALVTIPRGKQYHAHVRRHQWRRAPRSRDRRGVGAAQRVPECRHEDRPEISIGERSFPGHQGRPPQHAGPRRHERRRQAGSSHRQRIGRPAALPQREHRDRVQVRTGHQFPPHELLECGPGRRRSVWPGQDGFADRYGSGWVAMVQSAMKGRGPWAVGHARGP